MYAGIELFKKLCISMDKFNNGKVFKIVPKEQKDK